MLSDFYLPIQRKNIWNEPEIYMYVLCFEDPFHAKVGKRAGREGEASDIAAECPFPLPLTKYLSCLQLQDKLLAKIRKHWGPETGLSSLTYFMFCKERSIHLVDGTHASP